MNRYLYYAIKKAVKQTYRRKPENNVGCGVVLLIILTLLMSIGFIKN